ncbi:hypothetical protein AB9P05_00345 [Roseivirga sp. BDSF3-8]|uniref:hypothetical protein n=1 Tax=Roseivirga sp. BDSF3-8 TaxID=3241598 RepID=UPI003532419C
MTAKDGELLNFESYDFDPTFGFGLLLTAFFLSFGSRFFHDLLDRLYYAKKAKQALTDPEIYKQGSAAEVARFVRDYEIDEFYEDYREKLLEDPNVYGFSIEEVHHKGGMEKGVVLYTSLDKINRDIFNYKLNNKIYKIPHEVRYQDGPIDTTSVSLSDEIKNKSTKLTGSIGFAVEDNTDKYLITCYHVVKHPEHRWEFFGTALQEEIMIDKNTIGKLVDGKRDHFAEGALIRVDASQNIDPLYPNPSHKQAFKSINTDTSSLKDRRVKMYSRQLGKELIGTIKTDRFSGAVKYGRTPFKMYELIKIEFDEQPQRKGDSGNALLDDQNNILGLIIGKKGKYSYAVNIRYVMDLFQNKNLKLM